MLNFFVLLLLLLVVVASGAAKRKVAAKRKGTKTTTTMTSNAVCPPTKYETIQNWDKPKRLDWYTCRNKVTLQLAREESEKTGVVNTGLTQEDRENGRVVYLGQDCEPTKNQHTEFFQAKKKDARFTYPYHLCWKHHTSPNIKGFVQQFYLRNEWVCVVHIHERPSSHSGTKMPRKIVRDILLLPSIISVIQTRTGLGKVQKLAEVRPPSFKCPDPEGPQLCQKGKLRQESKCTPTKQRNGRQLRAITGMLIIQSIKI